MSEHILVASFAHEDDLFAAIEKVRKSDLQITEVYTPYAVHGLDRALGYAPSKLTWVCFLCGMTGALGMLWFQHWTAAVDWPLDVGGKPWNSLPSDAPVAFEAAVLLAGFGSVFALLGVSRLFPGKRLQLAHPRVTDDRFVLVIDQRGAAFDTTATTQLLQSCDAVDIEERVQTDGGDWR